ncbi:YciI family protein [uncultured Amnibacterium sp.]|uniref:YciI family protein n=1 Tax=uncultured Amnibacterium sp. TaxID=1631851 RepID=UPI0035CC00C4
MARYAILIYEDPAFYASVSPEAWPAVVGAHSTFVEQVFALGGSLAGGEALAPPTAATTIKGGSTVTDGPFLETREALNGIYVIEARDLDHAVEIAKRCPVPAAGGGVEVRPVVDPTTNPF